MKKLLWIVLALSVGLYIVTPVNDPDLWWHITVGRWIVSHAQVPVSDQWTIFGFGEPWRAYSWSTEILFSLVDRWWGDHGLLSLECIFGALLSLSLFFVFSKISNDYFFGALLGLYTTAATFNHFTLRPQVLVWIFFSLLILVSDCIAREGFKGRYKALLVGVMCLWANTHISSILGILAVALWLLKPKGGKVAATAALYAFGGTLVTPYGGGEWVTFLHTASHPFSHQSIAEFIPANITQYSTAFLVIYLFLLLTFFHTTPKGFASSRLFLVGVFILGALAVVKFLPFAMIVIGAVIASFWRTEGEKDGAIGGLGAGIKKLKSRFNGIPREGLSFVILCLCVLKVHDLWQSPLDRVVTPVSAMDFIQSNNLPHPLLNMFGNGGYVMYRLSDKNGAMEHRVSIDGRTNLISAQLWSRFQNAINGRFGWEKYLEMVNPETILWKSESPLTSILLEGGKWCMVFRSGRPEAGYVVLVNHAKYESNFSHLASPNCQKTDKAKV